MKADSELARQFQAGKVRNTVVYIVRAFLSFTSTFKVCCHSEMYSSIRTGFTFPSLVLKNESFILKPCLPTDGMNLKKWPFKIRVGVVNYLTTIFLILAILSFSFLFFLQA